MLREPFGVKQATTERDHARWWSMRVRDIQWEQKALLVHHICCLQGWSGKYHAGVTCNDILLSRCRRYRLRRWASSLWRITGRVCTSEPVLLVR